MIGLRICPSIKPQRRVSHGPDSIESAHDNKPYAFATERHSDKFHVSQRCVFAFHASASLLVARICTFSACSKIRSVNCETELITCSQLSRIDRSRFSRK